MRLHVLTASTRSGNLPRIAESLASAAQAAPAVDVAWHWRKEAQSVQAQSAKQSSRNALRFAFSALRLSAAFLFLDELLSYHNAIG